MYQYYIFQQSSKASSVFPFPLHRSCEHSSIQYTLRRRCCRTCKTWHVVYVDGDECCRLVIANVFEVNFAVCTCWSAISHEMNERICEHGTTDSAVDARARRHGARERYADITFDFNLTRCDATCCVSVWCTVFLFGVASSNNSTYIVSLSLSANIFSKQSNEDSSPKNFCGNLAQSVATLVLRPFGILREWSNCIDSRRATCSDTWSCQTPCWLEHANAKRCTHYAWPTFVFAAKHEQHFDDITCRMVCID